MNKKRDLEGQLNFDEKTDEEDNAVVSSAIGQQLKKLYDQVAEEPVPDRFTELLQQLENQESNKK